MLFKGINVINAASMLTLWLLATREPLSSMRANTGAGIVVSDHRDRRRASAAS